MTADTEQKIEQRQAMIARAKSVIELAQRAADACGEGPAKQAHLSQVYLRKQRVEELEKQIAQLKGVDQLPIPQAETSLTLEPTEE